MTLKSIFLKLKKKGIKGVLRKIKRIVAKNYIKNLNTVEHYFINKDGIEIGGPSKAFTNKGYIPLYSLMNSLDGVNFSEKTVWTGDINLNEFLIDGKPVGKMYIAEGSDLSSLNDKSYDFLLSCNNIEHIANPMKALEEWVKKLKNNGVVVIIAPKKESNFDHKRDIVKFEHLVDDFNKNIDENDLTHLEEILELHDLSLDKAAGTLKEFKERSLNNFQNRCLHHHVFDLDVLEKMCLHFNLKVLIKSQKEHDNIIIAEKIKSS